MDIYLLFIPGCGFGPLPSVGQLLLTAFRLSSFAQFDHRKIFYFSFRNTEPHGGAHVVKTLYSAGAGIDV